MGACLTHNAPALRIGKKVITMKEMRELTSYQDALKVVGIYIPRDKMLQIVTNDVVSFVYAFERFKIVDFIEYDGNSIPIEKLYGRK